MQVLKVKFVLWAADWQRCLKFYGEMFGGVVSFESEVWSEIVIAGATLGIHGGGEGKRTWTGLSFQLDDLREVPDELLSSIQQRVKDCSVTGEPYFHAEGTATELARYGHSAYFLDFETISFAVPRWAHTRPYQQLPFQFSLHIVESDGRLEHQGFLDLSGDDPSQTCAIELIRLCGTVGPIFAYNAGFESRVIRELGERFPDLATKLNAIAARLVDLLPIARRHYYHPSQHGSWSIKAVLPALCPDLSYSNLDGVQDGNMAQAAYQEAIAAATTSERKAEIQQQLHEYCKLDTFAMVRMWETFAGEIANSKRE